MIYTKTQLGQTVFQNRSVPLTPRQRAAFIMFDGKRSLGDVMSATTGLGVNAEDVGHLVSLGLLGPVVVPVRAPDLPTAFSDVNAIIDRPLAAPSFSPDGLPTPAAQAHYSRAYPIATRLTAGLGLRGFRLNLAVEAAGDLDKLKELSPRIKEAVGPVKFLELEHALYD